MIPTLYTIRPDRFLNVTSTRTFPNQTTCGCIEWRTRVSGILSASDPCNGTMDFQNVTDLTSAQGLKLRKFMPSGMEKPSPYYQAMNDVQEVPEFGMVSIENLMIELNVPKFVQPGWKKNTTSSEDQANLRLNLCYA